MASAEVISTIPSPPQKQRISPLPILRYVDPVIKMMKNKPAEESAGENVANVFFASTSS
jgi:hypothetical protein